MVIKKDESLSSGVTQAVARGGRKTPERKVMNGRTSGQLCKLGMTFSI